MTISLCHMSIKNDNHINHIQLQTNCENNSRCTNSANDKEYKFGYWDNTRSQDNIVNLFNTKNPETSGTQPCVSKIFCKFEEHGTVSDLPKTWRPKICDNDQSARQS